MSSEIGNASMNRVQNVFWIGVKAWAHVLLPSLRLDEGSKKAFSLQSLVGSPEMIENPVNMDAQVLATIPTTIRDILKARSNSNPTMLVSFVDVPIAYVTSLLSLRKDHAARVMFQAKIDRLYLSHGMNIQQFSKTQPRVPKDVIEFAVEFIYSDENIGHYRYALHAREGVKASEDTEDQCDYSHQPQEHKVQQLRAYQELEELVSQPDKLDDPGEQKCDANVVLSCFEAAFHVLRSRFPHIKKIIIQSDNAKNLAGKQSKLLLPHVFSAAGFILVAYYHNEAQSWKDVCDTHFSHQQTQVEAYLTQGEGGRKISTPKQLAVALMEKSTINTTVLLIKPNFEAPYRSAVCPSIKGISEFYVAQYITKKASNQQNILFYNCLGQTIPSACVHLPSCLASSLITPMGEDGINFTGVTVLLNSDNDDACTKMRMEKKRYTKRTKCSSKRELQKMAQQREHEEALRQIKALASLIGTGDEMPFTNFEPHFHSGWAYTRKNMHPELTTKVKTISNECWKAGENKDLLMVYLPGLKRWRYKRMPTSTTSKRKRGRPQSEGSIGTKKKARVSYEELDLAKDLLSWKKPELEAYLSHYNVKKSGNKSELIKRVEEHMFTVKYM
eukprot:Em0023g951a